MMRRLIVLLVPLFTSSMLVSAGPATGVQPRGDIYDQGAYNDPYSFTDKSCGFTIKVRGRAEGRYVNYNVPGSDGQAFLTDNHNRFIEAPRNPKNGKRLSVSGHSHFMEVSARHVRGDVYRFLSVERVGSFVIRDAEGHVVLRERGVVVRKTLFDTNGDSKPGGEVLNEKIVRKTGHLPTLRPGFDMCEVFTKHLTD